MSDPQVVILTKAPIPGRVKTRLIPALGAVGAARFHTALVHLTLRHVAASGLDGIVSLGGDPDGPFAQELRGLGFPVEPQCDGDLGARLRRAMRGPGRRIALGTDCPLFTPGELRSAALHPAPVVVGPAEDGGYWMMAIDAPQDVLFTQVPWSSPDTLAVTLRHAASAGLNVAHAPMHYDIDTPADLKRLLTDPRCPPALRDAAR